MFLIRCSSVVPISGCAPNLSSQAIARDSISTPYFLLISFSLYRTLTACLSVPLAIRPSASGAHARKLKGSGYSKAAFFYFSNMKKQTDATYRAS